MGGDVYLKGYVLRIKLASFALMLMDNKSVFGIKLIIFVETSNVLIFQVELMLNVNKN